MNEIIGIPQEKRKLSGFWKEGCDIIKELNKLKSKIKGEGK